MSCLRMGVGKSRGRHSVLGFSQPTLDLGGQVDRSPPPPCGGEGTGNSNSSTSPSSTDSATPRPNSFPSLLLPFWRQQQEQCCHWDESAQPSSQCARTDVNEYAPLWSGLIWTLITTHTPTVRQTVMPISALSLSLGRSKDRSFFFFCVFQK